MGLAYPHRRQNRPALLRGTRTHPRGLRLCPSNAFRKQNLGLQKRWRLRSHEKRLVGAEGSARLATNHAAFRALEEPSPAEPIFVKGKVYNSTANSVLARHCKNVGAPAISVHGLRHTHASLLLFAGVSIASVSRRLGHASMTTTQETYLHVIQELENKDIDIVMRALSTLI